MYDPDALLKIMNTNDFTQEELARMKELFADFDPSTPEESAMKPEARIELRAIMKAMAERKGKKIRELAES